MIVILINWNNTIVVLDCCLRKKIDEFEIYLIRSHLKNI